MCIIGGKLSHALRSNSRCTWRHSEGSQNVHNTVIRRALSPLRPCGSVTAYVHGCARRVAPSRHPIAIRDTPVAHTGGETPQSSHNATGCAACPSLLFSPPGHGFSTLDARWKLLIGQYTSGIMRGDTVGIGMDVVNAHALRQGQMNQKRNGHPRGWPPSHSTMRLYAVRVYIYTALCSL